MKKKTVSDAISKDNSGSRITVMSRYTAILIAAAALLIFFVAIFLYFDILPAEPESEPSLAYAAGTSKDVPVYVIEEDAQSGEQEARELERMIRGTRIRRYDDEEVMIGDAAYIRIEKSGDGGSIGETIEKAASDATADPQAYQGDRAETDEQDEPQILYMKADNISDTRKGAVRETEVYVRTPATVYAEETGPAIASFAPKGTCLRVTGYDRLNADGSVNKYRVAYQDADDDNDDEEGGAEAQPEGYVYGKYMTDSQKNADKKYNGKGIYDQAKKDKYGYDLHGGKASHLDYYPYEKPVIAGREFCSDARAMYLNCAAAAHPSEYIKLIKKTDCNAVVCDIKDGVLAYKSPVAEELSPRSYKTAYTSMKKYRKGIDALRDSGVYLIGRIVVFNDPIYAKDHPEDCIKYQGSTTWPSAYSRDVWEYNVRLAREAIEEFGFDEIQFDYVRFPESSYDMSRSKKTKWRNKYDEEKGQAVQNFCFYAADQIHDAGAYFSVDVFGESVYGYMTAYGQYWPGISGIVDAISAMPYTDHMGVDGAWEDPYNTMKSWAKKAKKQQKKLKYPAAARTWITGYDTPHWAPSVSYGNKKLRAQVKALKEQGLDGGFIPWNAASSLENYYKYQKVWNKK